MNKPLRLLIVEDFPDDAELMVMRLEEEGFSPDWQRVENEEDFLKALEEEPEFILADWQLPQFSGLRALELLNERGLDIPFILVSGSIGEEAAINALHSGASDYILKDRSKRLGQAVRRTLDSRRYQQEKEGAEAELKRRLAELESLYKISTTLRIADTQVGMLKILLTETLQALNTDAGAIWYYEKTEGKLFVAEANSWYSVFREDCVEPGQGIIGTVYSSGKPYISKDYHADSQASKKLMSNVPQGWGGVCLPIHAAEAVVAVIDVSVPQPREISPEDLKLLSSIAEMAGIAMQRITLFEELQASEAALVSAYHETIKGWANALELRDQETEGHSERVTEITLELAQKMGIKDEQLIHIYRGSLLHDIGKMGVSDTILLKPGSLDEREWEIMRQHPQYAYDLLAPIEYLKPALNIPYCHHEKFNGSGYPRGLKGDEIPLEARIFAVIDVYDALTSDRPYRLAWSKKDALKHIEKESGTHFDPQVVKLFLELIGKTD
jgi:response regulator RpfG family c-di-GMP phosphodiesterase